MVDSANIAKAILTIMYTLVFIISGVQFARMSASRAQNNLTSKIPLHFILTLAAGVRAVLMVIPIDVWDHLEINHFGWQVFFDILPEVLFWQTYFLLVLLWAELYHFSKNKKRENPRVPIMGVFVVVSGLAYIAGAIFIVYMKHLNKPKGDYDISNEAIFLSCLLFLALISFLLYGVLLHSSMQRVPLYPVHRKNRMLFKLKIMVVAVAICNVIHIAYLFLNDAVIDKMYREHKIRYGSVITIWFFYMVITEILPAIAVLFVFRKVTAKQQQYERLEASSG